MLMICMLKKRLGDIHLIFNDVKEGSGAYGYGMATVMATVMATDMVMEINMDILKFRVFYENNNLKNNINEL